MNVNDLTRILNSFDAEKQSFGYNPSNRHMKKYVVSPMIMEDDNMVSKEVLEANFKADQEEGMKKFQKSAEALRAEAGASWGSSKGNFRRGAAKSAKFIQDDDDDEEEPTFANNRFSKGINIKRELQEARDRKSAKEYQDRKANAEINRTEWQHMDFATSRSDRATRAVIRDRRKDANLDRDYNRVHETGNTREVTKERSRLENEKIAREASWRGKISLRTTLVMMKVIALRELT